jgi:hypothetical protein
MKRLGIIRENADSALGEIEVNSNWYLPVVVSIIFLEQNTIDSIPITFHPVHSLGNKKGDSP